MKKTVTKKQMGGSATGRSISEKAAARKVAKGKGTIAYNWGPGASEAGSESNKGDYIGYGKNSKTTVSGFKSLRDSKKPRPIRKKGGAVKKQMGGNAGSYTPPNQPGGKPTAGGYTAPKGTGLNSAPGKRQIKRDFKKMIRNQSKNG